MSMNQFFNPKVKYKIVLVTYGIVRVLLSQIPVGRSLLQLQNRMKESIWTTIEKKINFFQTNSKMSDKQGE